MPLIDPDKLRLTGTGFSQLKPSMWLRRRTMGRFLQGPIPLTWLSSAARLSGKAFHVGIWVWYRTGLKKLITVDLSLSALEREFGVSHYAAARGLKALEQANLVSVVRHPGRKAIVTVLNNRPEPSEVLSQPITGNRII